MSKLLGSYRMGKLVSRKPTTAIDYNQTDDGGYTELNILEAPHSIKMVHNTEVPTVYQQGSTKSSSCSKTRPLLVACLVIAIIGNSVLVVLYVKKIDDKKNTNATVGPSPTPANRGEKKNTPATVGPSSNRDVSSTMVAFTVKLSGTYPQAKSIIVSRKILTNIGGGYNSTSNIFTCPVKGLYSFHLHLISRSGSNGVLIYKNNQQMTIAYCGRRKGVDGGSASLVTYLHAGDIVTIQSNNPNLVVHSESNFSGWKIQ